MAELEREYRRALSGEFQCVLLLADAGIGKTRLARDFIARRRGTVTALPARAFQFGETAAFGVWSEAVEGDLRLDAPIRPVVRFLGRSLRLLRVRVARQTHAGSRLKLEMSLERQIAQMRYRDRVAGRTLDLDEFPRTASMYRTAS